MKIHGSREELEFIDRFNDLKLYLIWNIKKIKKNIDLVTILFFLNLRKAKPVAKTCMWLLCLMAKN